MSANDVGLFRPCRVFTCHEGRIGQSGRVPKQPKFRPVKALEGWRLNVPANLTVSGKRERYFFRTREAAIEEAAKLRDRREKFGIQASAISPSLAEQATAAVALLAPYGISLLDAAQRVAEAARAQAASVLIGEALDAFEIAKDAKSSRQVQAIRLTARHLRSDFLGRLLSSISGNEICTHLDARISGPAAFNAKLRILNTFWRWAAKPPREWCNAETLKHVDRKETISGEVGTLTAKEVGRLLAAAEKHLPDTVPAFAIAVFTGMRQDEIHRLTPADITAEGITVPALSSKTKRRRFVQMPEPLAAWLAAFPIRDSVTPPNWARKEKAVRRLAGWRVTSELVALLDLDPPLDRNPPTDLPEWPQNALRHTAASVVLALGKPLEQLVFEHGHAGGLEMLRRHYIGRMPRKEAMSIWTLGPTGSKLANLNIA